MRPKRPQVIMGTGGAGDASIPCVVITGFLGAGKTTLVEHILAHTEGKLVGCVVNDVAAINVDAKLVTDAADRVSGGKPFHVVTLEDGCICCERRGDLLPCIEQLLIRKASSLDQRQFDAIIIECTGLAEPSQLCSSFSEPPRAYSHVLERVHLASVVSVVDAAAFEAHYESRTRSRVDKQCIVDLLVAQVEVADLIVANKMDRIDDTKAGLIEDLMRSMNPRAAIMRTQFSRIPLTCLTSAWSTGVGVGDLAASGVLRKSPLAKRARADAHRAETTRLVPSSISARVKRAVNRFVYVRDRPFHPVRLAETVIDKLPTLRATGEALGAQEEGEQDSSTNPLARLLRSKGFVWLASQPHICYRWSYAGCHFQLSEHEQWEDRAQGRRANSVPAGSGRVGDGKGVVLGDPATLAVLSVDPAPSPRPGQQLIFIGLDLSEAVVSKLLDRCLLTDWEMTFFREGIVPPAEPSLLDDDREGHVPPLTRTETSGVAAPRPFCVGV